MAEYSDTTLYIKGSKKAVVGFLNRGLKSNKSKGRIPVRKIGEEIIELLNGSEKPLQMGSYLPRPKTFDTWDTTNNLNDLYQWYIRGCVRHSDSEILDQRVSEIQDFMEAHPADFQKVPLEKDPLFSDPDEAEFTLGFEYADKLRALRMLHPELIQEYEKYVRGHKRAKAYQQKKYGVVGWYDWNVKYYGCKWDEKLENWELKCERDNSIVLSAKWKPHGLCRWLSLNTSIKSTGLPSMHMAARRSPISFPITEEPARWYGEILIKTADMASSGKPMKKAKTMTPNGPRMPLQIGSLPIISKHSRPNWRRSS